jgi:hypothetical protein
MFRGRFILSTAPLRQILIITFSEENEFHYSLNFYNVEITPSNHEI